LNQNPILGLKPTLGANWTLSAKPADAQGKYANEKISTVKFKIRPESNEPGIKGV
jgi:hypothetical protein